MVNRGRVGATGTPMLIERRPRMTKKQKKKAAKARYYRDEKKIGKEAMQRKAEFEKQIRTGKRNKPVPKSDVIETQEMRSLKEQAIAEGKYLSKKE